MDFFSRESENTCRSAKKFRTFLFPQLVMLLHFEIPIDERRESEGRVEKSCNIAFQLECEVPKKAFRSKLGVQSLSQLT